MKKLSFCLLLIVLAAFFTTTAVAAPAAPEEKLTAKGVYLYNLDTDTLIYEIDANEPMAPSALTMIMTAIVVLENTDNLDSEMAKYPNYVQDWLYTYQYGENGKGAVHTANLMAGEEMSVRDLLYGMLVPSANECAMILADHVGGSQEGFVQMMNDKAKELGCTNTNFTNATGLHDSGHYSTPRDMFLIAKYAMELPGFMDIVSTTSYVSAPTNLHSDGLSWNTTNRMMVSGTDSYYAPVKGIKTGTSQDTGYCFVSTATKSGYTYLAVVIGASMKDNEGNTAFSETKALYEWVFAAYKQQMVYAKGKFVVDIPLRLSSERDYLQLMAGDRFNYLLPEGIDTENDIKRDYELPEYVKAPIQKYDHVGYVVLTFNGEEIGRIELQAMETVGASSALVLLDKIRSVMASFWFKFGIVFLLLLIIAYVILMLRRNRNRRSGTYKPRRRV